jgi:hypothetical protein
LDAANPLVLSAVEGLPDPSVPNPERRAYRNGILVAAVMRRSEGAVKMLVSRAVADLRRRCLDEEEIE